MPDITLEEIQQKFDSLPENLRLAIIVAGADKKINTIGREHGLNIKQIAELLLRTHVVMFGFVHPDKLEDLVREITKIPPQVVKGITRDVNEQIIKDIKEELIGLAERPENAKEVEAFIGESTPGGKSMTPEELTASQLPVALPPPNEKENIVEKEDSILKSTGIEIPILESEKTIEEKIKTADEEISKKEKEEIKPTIEDKEGSAILKSAGIEIPSLTFGNEIPSQPVPMEKIKPQEDTTPKTETKIIPETPIETSKENEEVLKIAFTDLPKETPSVLPITKTTKPEEIKDTTPKEETKESEKKIVESGLTGIYAPITTPFAQKDKETKTIEAPVTKEEKPVVTEQIVKDIPTQTEVPAKEKIETKVVEKIEEKKVPEIKEAIEQKTEEKKVEIITPTKEIEKASTETKKEEGVKEETKEQTPEETKKNADLKLAVKNIIDKYQNKQEEPVLTYNNKEEEKRAIVMQIVEVQDGIKKMKDRMNQLIKERAKLEKEKRALAGKGDTKGSKDLGDSLAELGREEKMIQVLRESILPKEYLDLLVRLDKLSAENPPQNQSK